MSPTNPSELSWSSNHNRHQESLINLTPADVDFERAKEILDRREKIKRDSWVV